NYALVSVMPWTGPYREIILALLVTGLFILWGVQIVLKGFGLWCVWKRGGTFRDPGGFEVSVGEPNDPGKQCGRSERREGVGDQGLGSCSGRALRGRGERVCTPRPRGSSRR